MQTTKINTIFDWVKQSQHEKLPWSSFSSEEHDIFSNFMFNKIMSMDPSLIEVVAEIQEFSIPKEKLYQFYCQVLPKQKSYSKFIKPTKPLYNNEVLKSLSSYFQVSTREVLDYCYIFTKPDIIDILLQMGMDDKEIKKILK
jgi:hypothetical protein